MSEDQLLLIAAAVDGELSAGDALRLRTLLDSSTEARAVLARLQRNRTRLGQLPPVAPPAQLHARIMARIAKLAPPTPAEPARPHGAPRTPSWAPIAVAASLLIAVAGSSYWYFTRESTTNARNPNRPPPATRNGAADPAWANWLPVDGARPPSAPMPQERIDTGVAKNDPHPQLPKPPTVDSIAEAPTPRLVQNPLIGAPIFPPIPPLNLVQIRLPLLKNLGDFEREAVRLELATELARDPAYRVDLFSRDPARAVPVFLAAARSEGLAVHADAATMNLLKKGQVNAIAIYTEALTAAEVADLVAKLNSHDAKFSPRHFDVVHAAPVVRSDEVELRGLLGVDPGLFKRALPAPERDPTKPINSGTGDQIVKTIGAGKAAEKLAVLLTWSPAQVRTAPANSAELKTYLSKRGDRKPKAVPVLIVIRHGNG